MQWVGKWWIGHSIIVYKDYKLYVQDSYSKSKCDIYSLDLDESKLKELFFWSWYIYIPKSNIMNQLRKDIQTIKLWITINVIKNKNLLNDVKKWNYTQDVKSALYSMRVYNILKSD